MATIVVGDVQGCFTTFSRLLSRVGFDRRRDRLWLAGDLVNRGPRSLDMLRWAVDHDDRVVAVLGNHDIHLLAAASGLRTPRGSDTLDAILAAPDRDDLLRWLRTRPLVHAQAPFVMVHAGLWPTWSVADALALSAQVSAALARGDAGLRRVHGAALGAWSDVASADTRAALALALMTRMRMLDADGRPSKYDGGPHDRDAPRGAVPWYAAPGRRSADHTVLFGHWAAHDHVLAPPSHIALDSGCVWGRALTAVRLDDLAVFQERAADGIAGSDEA